MSLADYLAKNYLSADPQSTKKRKRKDKPRAEGLTIAEDDVNTWTSKSAEDDEDQDTPTIVGGVPVGVLRSPTKKLKWVRVGVGAPKDAEQAAADAILKDAQKESQARAQQDDDYPTIVGEDGGEYDEHRMASGAMAGLQTAAQVSKALKKKQREDFEAMKAAGLDSGGLAQQTIYRDASGRMINVKEKKQEAESKAREVERNQTEDLEARKGDVQRQQKEERRKDLEEAKVMTFARGADDEKMNAELKERERWNDPMAQLLATKKSSNGCKGKAGGKSYQGAYEPNRYGIRPGWRWDGVDRGNGFERKWFAARNRAKDRERLEYAWQLDE